MTDTTRIAAAIVPLANTLASKRIRVRKCGSRLRVPAERRGNETIFTCGKEKHDEAIAHEETGYIHMPNDTVRWYHIEWRDEGVARLRTHTPTAAPAKPRVRKLYEA